MKVREVGDSGLTLCPVLLYGASSSRFGEWAVDACQGSFD